MVDGVRDLPPNTTSLERRTGPNAVFSSEACLKKKQNQRGEKVYTPPDFLTPKKKVQKRFESKKVFKWKIKLSKIPRMNEIMHKERFVHQING